MLQQTRTLSDATSCSRTPSMPICIECRYPVHQLYSTYSKADDRSLGKGVRLTQCPRCKRFADKYVEHDFVVLFIDLVLIKPQVSEDSCPTLLYLGQRSVDKLIRSLRSIVICCSTGSGARMIGSM